MGVSYKRLREIIREEIVREHMRLTRPSIIFTRSGLELEGSVLYDINALREMSWNDLVGLELSYPIHVCAELQDNMLLPESIDNLDHLTEMVDLYTSLLISEALLANLLESADDDLVTRLAEFVRTRAEADGSDLSTLPKADLMQTIVDAALDEGVPDDEMPDTEDMVLDMLVQNGDVPSSYQE
jgi:hypothetical protein